MKNGHVEAQDFSTSELIEALRERGFETLTAIRKEALRAEAALAEREACAEILSKAADRMDDALELLSVGEPRWREIVEARNALIAARDAIRAREQLLAAPNANA